MTSDLQQSAAMGEDGDRKLSVENIPELQDEVQSETSPNVVTQVQNEVRTQSFGQSEWEEVRENKCIR